MAVMSSQSATGGVRNLRAIFEHRSSDISTSPPSRGRSPNGSVTSSHSRPLSKVRTSFVAVEKPGGSGGPPQLGLRRALEDLNNSAIMDDTESSGPGLGAILKGSPFEDSGRPKKAANPTPKPVKTEAPKTNGIAEKAAAVGKKVQEGATKLTTTKPATAKTPTTATAAGKPPAQEKPDAPAQTNKSPVVAANPSFPKPRGGGAKIQAVMESAREAREARAAAAQTKTESEPKKETNKVPTPTSAKAPRASLPARLSRPTGTATAPTASSVAKNESNHGSEEKPAERKAVARGPPRVANVTTASSLAKKSTRASLGVTEQPKSRASAPRALADEGFLARMMRPTASSAQKTHDKSQAENEPHPKPTIGHNKAVRKPTSRKSGASTVTQEASEQDLVDSISEEAASTPDANTQAVEPETTADISQAPPQHETDIPATN